METGEEIWMRYSEAKLPALVTVRKGRDFPGSPGVRIRHFHCWPSIQGVHSLVYPERCTMWSRKKKRKEERGSIVQDAVKNNSEVWDSRIR